jgi:ankyrin repeat protein
MRFKRALGIVLILIGVSTYASAQGEDLVRAAEKGQTDVVQSLIAKGADVNLKVKGWTALMWASWNGRTKTVQALLAAKAEVNVTSDSGLVALLSEKDYRNEEMLNKMVTSFVANSMDGKTIDKGRIGFTALIGAAQRGHLDVVDALLGAGANPDATDESGETALMFAAKIGCTPIVKALVAKRANLNLRRNNNRSALIVAALTGNSLSTQAFMSQSGETALMFAAWNGDTSTVQELINGGADVNVKDNSGRTARTGLETGMLGVALDVKGPHKFPVNSNNRPIIGQYAGVRQLLERAETK